MLLVLLAVAACAPQSKGSDTVVLCLPSNGTYVSSLVRAGVENAAKDAGRDDLILMACDETKENLDLLEQGKMDALMVNDLYQAGYLCAQNLAKLMAGEEVEWYTEIEEKVLTRESDLTYYKELWERIE